MVRKPRQAAIWKYRYLYAHPGQSLIGWIGSPLSRKGDILSNRPKRVYYVYGTTEALIRETIRRKFPSIQEIIVWE